ncbi:MAG: hypothetical protein FWH27_13990 [Planctomycetaceae bacterium]|nr:hypothetical protein [Planctomycetaceae bacterium]
MSFSPEQQPGMSVAGLSGGLPQPVWLFIPEKNHLPFFLRPVAYDMELW